MHCVASGYIAIMTTPAEFLAPDGRLAARLPAWESRPQQLEMADLVAAAIRDRRHLVVEAGTGVGKSLAYLIPAVLAATADQAEGELAVGPPAGETDHEDGAPEAATVGRPRRVVISTHTIALQEQLVGKDIPLVQSVMPREFSAVLVKGRGNYLSKRRLAMAVERRGSLFQEQRDVDELKAVRGPAIAALLFLSPLFFTVSIAAGARGLADAAAISLGFLLQPIAQRLIGPELDLLFVGLFGGTAAFLLDRAMRRGTA